MKTFELSLRHCKHRLGRQLADGVFLKGLGDSWGDRREECYACYGFSTPRAKLKPISGLGKGFRRGEME